MPRTYLTAVDREYAGILREINGQMKAKKITTEQLAQEIRRGRSTLSLKLNGKTPLTVPELLRIKEVLDV